MSKGSLPVENRQGLVVGHYVYSEGKGWVYRPLPVPKPWVVLDA